jgi:hydroxymethylpyrimidine pyrophosphatase-like HAD family hydrolase
MMMATQMTYKQIGKNLVEKYLPWFLYASQLKDLESKFSKFITIEKKDKTV